MVCSSARLSPEPLVLVDTVSGAPFPAPIAPPLCRPRPPAACRSPPAPSGIAPAPAPPFGLSVALAAFTSPDPLPVNYKDRPSSHFSRRRTFFSPLLFIPVPSPSPPPPPAPWPSAPMHCPFHFIGDAAPSDAAPCALRSSSVAA